MEILQFHIYCVAVP